MNRKFNRRATDKISPQLFRPQAKKKDLAAFGNDVCRPSLHCYDVAAVTAPFIQEILRTTVALANTSGGVVLYRAEFDSRSCRLTLHGIFRKRLQRFKVDLAARIARDIIPALEVKMWMIEVERQKGRYALALMVPASRACPHMLTVNDENMIYVYEHARPMRADLFDVEQLFQRKLVRKMRGSGGDDHASVELTEEELKFLLP